MARALSANGSRVEATSYAYTANAHAVLTGPANGLAHDVRQTGPAFFAEQDGGR